VLVRNGDRTVRVNGVSPERGREIKVGRVPERQILSSKKKCKGIMEHEHDNGWRKGR